MMTLIRHNFSPNIQFIIHATFSIITNTARFQTTILVIFNYFSLSNVRLPWFGNTNAKRSRRDDWPTMPRCASPSWCTQRRRPGWWRPFWGLWWQRLLPCPSFPPTSLCRKSLCPRPSGSESLPTNTWFCRFVYPRSLWVLSFDNHGQVLTQHLKINENIFKELKKNKIPEMIRIQEPKTKKTKNRADQNFDIFTWIISSGFFSVFWMIFCLWVLGRYWCCINLAFGWNYYEFLNERVFERINKNGHSFDFPPNTDATNNEK